MPSPLLLSKLGHTKRKRLPDRVGFPIGHLGLGGTERQHLEANSLVEKLQEQDPAVSKANCIAILVGVSAQFEERYLFHGIEREFLLGVFRKLADSQMRPGGDAYGDNVVRAR